MSMSQYLKLLNVTLLGKGVIADIKLRIFRGDHPELLNSGPCPMTRVLQQTGEDPDTEEKAM